MSYSNKEFRKYGYSVFIKHPVHKIHNWSLKLYLPTKQQHCVGDAGSHIAYTLLHGIYTVSDSLFTVCKSELYCSHIYHFRSKISSDVNTRHILLYLVSVLEEDVLVIQNETSSFVTCV
jgi:hypothetical protein